jgi:hypothetical protein
MDNKQEKEAVAKFANLARLATKLYKQGYNPKGAEILLNELKCLKDIESVLTSMVERMVIAPEPKKQPIQFVCKCLCDERRSRQVTLYVHPATTVQEALEMLATKLKTSVNLIVCGDVHDKNDPATRKGMSFKKKDREILEIFQTVGTDAQVKCSFWDYQVHPGDKYFVQKMHGPDGYSTELKIYQDDTVLSFIKTNKMTDIAINGESLLEKGFANNNLLTTLREWPAFMFADISFTK